MFSLQTLFEDKGTLPFCKGQNFVPECLIVYEPQYCSRCSEEEKSMC